MTPHARILLVDDEETTRRALAARLAQDGHDVVEASTAEQGLRLFGDGVDLVVLSYVLPDQEGVAVLHAMQQADPDAAVIVLMNPSRFEQAVDCMKHGAYHCASRACNPGELSNLITRALEATGLRREIRDLRARQDESLGQMIGDSTLMVEVRALLRRIAESPASTVLITGESGTGKDLAARAIHGQSTRRSKAFMNITCSALADTLLESELFGHERGAFTDAKQQKKGLLEQADGGTVFLDEIGEMAPGLQSKLLRFLEEKAFRRVGGTVDIHPDVRVVAATHRDLHEDVRSGRFREDLYYRLAVLHVHLPPLRERDGDIELLARHYVAKFNHEFHKSVVGLSPGVVRRLGGHCWPGNVRELKNVVERAMLLTDGDILGVADLHITHSESPPAVFRLPPGGVDLRELERDLVVQALQRAHGNQTQAAKLLGLNRDQIRYRIAKYELDREMVGVASNQSA